MSRRPRYQALDPVRGRALRDRLLTRAQTSRAAASQFVTVPYGEGAWTPITPGTRAKRFDQLGASSALVEMKPGASLPTHHHHAHEHCLVLHGEVRLGDLRVGKGDYHIAPAGTRHSAVYSPSGALLFLRGAPIVSLAAMARSVISAWLPASDDVDQPVTIRASEGVWLPRLPKVDAKHFENSRSGESALLRLQPSAVMPAHALTSSEEFLLIEGEAFFGDMLLRAGDYWFAPTGSPELIVSSDVGALLYRHGAPSPL